MSKHLNKDCFFRLPSGDVVHPCRFIFKDGTLMWKHAFLCNNKFTELPKEQAHEQHIIKTAQRLEELNVWVSQDLEPWQCLTPKCWYDPSNPNLSDGISVYFRHSIYSADNIYETLKDHIQPHETLELIDSFPRSPAILFKRC